MTTGSFTKRRRWLGPGFFLLALTTFFASGATPKRVLILDSFGRDIAPFNAGASAFRTTLARELGEPVDIHEALLDAARFAEPEKEGDFVEFLKSRFAGRELELVVPVGSPAVLHANLEDVTPPAVPLGMGGPLEKKASEAS